MSTVFSESHTRSVSASGPRRRFTWLAFATIGLLAMSLQKTEGNEFRCAPAVVRWAIESDSLRQAPAADAAPIGTVSKGSMLAVLPIESTPDDRSFIFVKPIGTQNQRAGWIPYSSTATSLAESHLSDRGWNSTAVSGMPILIQRLPEAQREDWRRLSKAIAAAEREGVFVPEAYVARAELWTIGGDASKAVEDLRLAADTALKADRSLLEQAAYLRLLRDSLERLEKAPRPAEGARGNDYETAASHYGSGVHLFWRKYFSESVGEFDNAIALNPKEPAFWYFRGLARRQLGDAVRSQHDVLVGAFLERTQTVERGESKVLSRIQGPDRYWLEDFRRGDPSQQLLRLELAGVNVRPGVSP